MVDSKFIEEVNCLALKMSNSADVRNLAKHFEKVANDQKPDGKTKHLAGQFERKIENQAKSAAKGVMKKGQVERYQ